MTIRPATPEDVPAIAALIEAAYARYVERLGRRPSPMDDDHAAYVARGESYVLVDDDDTVVGAILLMDRDDHLFVDNLAVAPEHHGRGLGRTLLEFADAEARRRGLRQLRLHTNAAMTENLAIYPRLGYERTGRQMVGVYDRVFFSKRI
jgi:ribosomal protein S18 acetylase RimI-like enzyme